MYLISELQILKIVDLFSFVVEESSFKETLLLASSNEFKIEIVKSNKNEGVYYLILKMCYFQLTYT